MPVHHERRAALAGLAVDADDRLVLPPDVGRVDRQVRHLPVFRAALRHIGDALVDRILMRPGKRGEHELAGIGVPLVDVHARTLLIHALDVVHIREVQHRVDALRVEVHREVHQVAVAGALAVAEHRALHALRAGHDAELRRSRRRAAVVVRVDAQYRAVAVLHVRADVFDLVGVAVRRRELHGVRQVDDRLFLRRRAERLEHAVADPHGVFDLGARKALGRILVAQPHVRILPLQLLRHRADQRSRLHGDRGHAGHVRVKDDLSL